jgi:hypothetical protein
LAFDPAHCKQTFQGYRRFGKLARFDPAATSKVLHDLSFAVIGNGHHNLSGGVQRLEDFTRQL